MTELRALEKTEPTAEWAWATDPFLSHTHTHIHNTYHLTAMPAALGVAPHTHKTA